MKALNLQEAKSVQTPGEDEKSWQEEEDRECLNNQDASQYRALAARANYTRFGPPGHPVRGQGDMQGDEQPHPR